MATTKASKYSAIKVKPCKLKPKKRFSGIINEIKIAYTGNLAEHVMNGVIKIVINRSFQFSIFLALIMAGMAQAVPEIKGTILFPDNPNLRIILSIKNTTRLI